MYATCSQILQTTSTIHTVPHQHWNLVSNAVPAGFVALLFSSSAFRPCNAKLSIVAPRWHCKLKNSLPSSLPSFIRAISSKLIFINPVLCAWRQQLYLHICCNTNIHTKTEQFYFAYTIWLVFLLSILSSSCILPLIVQWRKEWSDRHRDSTYNIWLTPKKVGNK